MIVLALDTATSSTVAGLRMANGAICGARDDVRPGARPRHTQRLLALAAGLLGEAGIGFAELDLIVVGIGPGTFTGLRIGIASARGLAQATGTPLVGLSTLRVLGAGAGRPEVWARPMTGRGPGDGAAAATGRGPGDGAAAASGRGPGGGAGAAIGRRPGDAAGEVTGRGQGQAGAVLALIDAGRGEVFVAGYEDGREILAPTAVAPGGVAALAGGRRWLAVGSGALRFRGQFADADVTVPPDESPSHRVSAAVMLGLALDDDVDARGPVTPLYLRLPDAELALRTARP